MTQATPPVPSAAQYTPVAPVKGSRAMAGCALALGISAFIPLVGLLTGIIGIILGFVALVKRKAGRGMAIAGIAVGGVGILIGQPVAILLPGFIAERDSQQTDMCQFKLRFLGRQIDSYRRGYNDKHRYPADLAELVSEGFIPKSSLRCPGPGASDDARHSLALKDGREITSNYFYLPPAAGADPMTIIMCDYRGNHKDGRNVLYAETVLQSLDTYLARARFLEEEVFRSQLALPKNAAFAKALREVEPP